MDALSTFLSGGAGAAVVTAAYVILQLILNKKLKTPADKTAEVTTVLTFFREGIADSRADRIALEGTLSDLREYVSRLEKDSREDFAIRVKLEERIAELERRISEKDIRIVYLEQELSRYTTDRRNED